MNQQKRQSSQQSGFALATVLILLLILAGVVFVVLDGQRAKLLQSEAVIVASETEQDSHNAHNACLSQVKAVLASGSTQTAIWWSDAGGVVQENDGRWQQALSFLGGKCLIEVITDASDSPSQWTPKLRISSRVIGAKSTKLEQTEWRYPACNSTLAGQCLTLTNAIRLRDNSATWTPAYQSGQAVLVAHRMY